MQKSLPKDSEDRRLAEVIERRAARRGLHVDIERLRYANAWLLKNVPADAKALFVGVGHGHDALLALLDGHCGQIVGVDPYIETHGNGDQDYMELSDLIEAFGYEHRFELRRRTIQQYIEEEQGVRFDAIVCADVLHHIFVTPKSLLRSPDGPPATELFRQLCGLCKPGARLVVSETSRHGLRPWLSRISPHGGDVDYSTKQHWGQWRDAARDAGWRFLSVRDYVPWALRQRHFLFANAFGRYTTCDRYALEFAADEPVDE